LNKLSDPKGVPAEISEDAMTRLLLYNWPGNILELQNVIERAAILRSGSVVRKTDLPPNLQFSMSGLEETKEIPSLIEMERRLIMKTLEKTGGDRSAAAMLLRIARSLTEKMKALGLEPI
jgi:DNA-binding NtrC family response regulator